MNPNAMPAGLDPSLIGYNPLLTVYATSPGQAYGSLPPDPGTTQASTPAGGSLLLWAAVAAAYWWFVMRRAKGRGYGAAAGGVA